MARSIESAGARFQRPAVEHDPWRNAMATGAARQQPCQRHLAVFEHVGVVDVQVGWHVLHRELDAGQLLGEAALQRLDGVQYKIVEDLGLGPRERHVGRYQPAAQPPAVPVTPIDLPKTYELVNNARVTWSFPSTVPGSTGVQYVTSNTGGSTPITLDTVMWVRKSAMPDNLTRTPPHRQGQRGSECRPTGPPPARR